VDAYAILIPARHASTRLPGKMLLRESGKPLVVHVLERARQAPGSPRILVLTDDARIVDAVAREGGGEARMTRADHASGTDRCAEAAADLEEDVIVNVQGDEPLFAPGDLAALAAAVASEGADIATLGWPFPDARHMADPHAVKAVVDAEGWAVDFTRDAERALAFQEAEGDAVLHHVGIYAFRRERLLAFPGLERTVREQTERLEQLRALEHGWRIRVLPASAPAFGIDTREDYDAFLATFGGA
jgi:3-deoxy-manno-octulosonate cytidylyltransferase (CMP-KDO synthetase)